MAYTVETIKRHLKKLNDNWNDEYWIYVAGGTLHLMRNKNGERVVLPNGGVDARFISSSHTEINADGGDW